MAAIVVANRRLSVAFKLIHLSFDLVLGVLATGTQTGRLQHPQMPTTSLLRDLVTERPSMISIRAFDSAWRRSDLEPVLKVATAVELSLSWIEAMHCFLYSCLKSAVVAAIIAALMLQIPFFLFRDI